jgi:CARDB protein
MKRMIVFTSLLLLGIASQTFAQQPIRDRKVTGSTDQSRQGPNTQVAVLPDLVVTGIEYDEKSGSTIHVHVRNQGNGNAKACYLALMALKSNSQNSGPAKVWSVEIPALGAQKSFSTTIHISPFTYADRAFLARIDRSDQVKESDESNNDRFDNSKVIH